MTVFCISPFDKFSRFYLQIGKNLKPKRQLKLNIYGMYFSGFLYAFIRGNYSMWLPAKAWFKVRKNNKNYSSILLDSREYYKGIKFNEHINFHLKLNKGISKSNLQKQALAYIDLFQDEFKKFKPDVLLSIGDTRLCAEIAIAVAKEKNIPIKYIEQGPFNSTFYDNEGVNANLSIGKEDVDKFEYKPTTKQNRNISQPTSKYLRSPLYRGIDILLMKLFERTELYPPDLKHTDVISFRFAKTIKLNSELMNKNSALLVCQLPSDVNLINHSPNYKSQFDILKDVFENMPNGLSLVVREHPLFIGKYSSNFYTFIKKHQIRIENNVSLDSALDSAKVVIVNNSTVGFEAICKYKATIVLGNAFYDHSKLCLKLHHRNQLKILLEESVNYEPNKKVIDNFVENLRHNVLIDGSIKDKNLKSAKFIANDLIKSF